MCPSFFLDRSQNYLVSQGERRVVLRNYEGFMVAYDNPRNYHAHDEATCKVRGSEECLSFSRGVLPAPSFNSPPALLAYASVALWSKFSFSVVHRPPRCVEVQRS